MLLPIPVSRVAFDHVSMLPETLVDKFTQPVVPNDPSPSSLPYS